MRLSMVEDEYNWLLRTLADDLEQKREFKLHSSIGENGNSVIIYSNNNGCETYDPQTLGKRLNEAIGAYNREKVKEKIYNMDVNELKDMVCKAFEEAKIDFEIKDGGKITGIKEMRLE